MSSQPARAQDDQAERLDREESFEDTALEEIDLGPSAPERGSQPNSERSEEEQVESHSIAASQPRLTRATEQTVSMRSDTRLSTISQSDNFVSARGSERGDAVGDDVPAPELKLSPLQRESKGPVESLDVAQEVANLMGMEAIFEESTNSADDLKKAGNARFAEGEYEEAAEFYTRAIQLDDTNATLFSNRSAAYFKLGRFDEARGDAEATIALRSTWSKGYWRKANVEMAQKRFDVALEILDLGLMYNAGDVDLINARQLVIASLPAISESTAHLLEPNDTDSADPGNSQACSTFAARDDDAQQSEAKVSCDAKRDGIKDQIREILSSCTHYDVLGVDRSANLSLIKARYYRLARDLHPDKCHQDGAESAMQCVTAAYGVLTSPVKKQLYDRYLTECSAEESADGTTKPPDLSYAEWESRQSFNMLPPLLACILRIPVFGWAVGLTLFVLMLPVLLLMVVMYVLLYIMCLPYRLVLMCCCPEQYDEMREHEKKQEARWEEEEQYKRFAHV
mmetsp:Transcript_6566/g.17615  ORF Transcript_6566/g.17615 Transcript_6566/m.17615 type:complete len:511 (+) Transcript_6566:189-1721(+)|eukprot:CAMPEP_0185830124 /NCGR_PEP_ID=MMETSP1353-20130828/640_1 /TAXON_ID=1077150 /ORGANISM="Erythrolobus australicus, Strain CCMP3124" /LENGTH=510 /DNA_ID=CAMNT_0028527981 /DNA_START=173 /DNA_END=1705 /DNA_ORIENTATION=+